MSKHSSDHYVLFCQDPLSHLATDASSYKKLMHRRTNLSYIFFSNSLIIHQVETKEIRTVTASGYLISISRDFLRFYFFVFSSVLVSVEKIYQTLKIVLNHFSKHLEVCQKYSATRRIFKSLLAVWKCGQAWSFVFDILLHSR